MLRRRIPLALVSLAAAVLAFAPAAQAQVSLRVMTHASFDLPKDLLARFEKDAGVSLQLIKAGDAGEMLNKLILTRARPVADAVFGIDNTLLPRALAAKVLEPYEGPAMRRDGRADLPGPLVPVDYGYVNLNIDKAWFASHKLALPRSLEELAGPTYRNLLVVQNPATSSPGQAFLLATIAGLGEEGAFDWWARMRTNGVKVVKGWSEAYYTEFSRNGGTRPIVVSYATSPAAEVFYSEKKISEPPTANLFLKGGVYRQVEGAGLVRGGNPAAREAAGRFIEFMRSPDVQQALQTSMWMFPVESGVPRDPVMQHADEPAVFDALTPEQLGKAAAWQQRWTRVVLKQTGR
ncbi:MAG: thiamine ABC transporter substrate-binding protein [Burkholderiaceae bacterium]